MAQAEHRGLSRLLRVIDARRWLRHGLFWVVYLMLCTIMLRYCVHMVPTLRLALRDALLVTPVHMLNVYLLLYGVLPRLWQRQQPRLHIGWWLVGWFWLSLGLTFVFRYLMVVPLHAGEPNTPREYQLVFSPGNFFCQLAVVGVAVSLRMYRHWWKEELTNLRLTQENYRAELQLLKAQIHPHFLFNTLNSLYALTLKQSDQAPAVVERLTSLLHAVLTQSRAPLVPLADEITLLRNFIALERLRYGNRLTIAFETGAVPPTGYVAPLLLLPLVENAFKHGAAEQLGQAHVHVVLARQATTLFCCITNSKNIEDAPTATSSTGIGLRNVRERLQLLYPQRHRLQVEARPDTFTVRLLLPLAEAPQAAATAPPLPEAQARPALLPALSPQLQPVHESAA
ncbi:sensor histidine kinase [Hymenobacter metallicola]|uniref:Signal transduction histidine kinase internal region domain-containing protein n=1 Tax=Hymenobacter metallicola TaxID=2563114 RepID=A0A4Z0PTG6_9BACT|nr:histidine kinase [Hymenobacter metallicola]TGE20977.1 hypothetical protein E5K02_24750 [Hymenobacter metallicola]